MSWMDNKVESDIQTALQSQYIQTSLEQNTSRITDAGFQSYLQNAPIPRFYVNSFSNTFATSATTVVLYNSNGTPYVDPYRMLVPTTGVATIPIDGFYEICFNFKADTGTTGYLHAKIIDNASAYIYGNEAQWNAAATGFMGFTIGTLVPLKAGTTFRVDITNFTGGTVTASVGAFSAVWTAPYNQYTTGPGGN